MNKKTNLRKQKPAVNPKVLEIVQGVDIFNGRLELAYNLQTTENGKARDEKDRIWGNHVFMTPFPSPNEPSGWYLQVQVKPENETDNGVRQYVVRRRFADTFICFAESYEMNEAYSHADLQETIDFLNQMKRHLKFELDVLCPDWHAVYNVR